MPANQSAVTSGPQHSVGVDDAAELLQQLGNVTRLGIVRLLVQAGPEGLAVGEIQSRLQVAASTLSHHLSRLRGVGLVTQRRDGTTLYCSLQYGRLDQVVTFLTDECCKGFDSGAC